MLPLLRSSGCKSHRLPSPATPNTFLHCHFFATVRSAGHDFCFILHGIDFSPCFVSQEKKNTGMVTSLGEEGPLRFSSKTNPPFFLLLGSSEPSLHANVLFCFKKYCPNKLFNLTACIRLAVTSTLCAVKSPEILF